MTKKYLITGGTGSFGKSMIRRLLSKKDTKKVVCFSRDELKQYELSLMFPDKRLRLFIGDVRDKDRLKLAFKDIDTIIHAAAMKQVPASEYNPTECINTNIRGAENIISAALDSNITKVIALSTDKAVNPINLYGATKLAADKLFIAANSYSGKKNISFSNVRYGNVINSRGSVIPYFLNLLNQKSKFLPITHKDMTRFVLSLDEGVDFVLKSLNLMRGGETFVPKIPSIKITEIANAISPNTQMKLIGIRPGEKLHEILCPADECYNTINFKDYFVIKPSISFGKKINYFKSVSGEIGTLVKDGFEYNSLNNPKYLKQSQIIKIIENLRNYTN